MTRRDYIILAEALRVALHNAKLGERMWESGGVERATCEIADALQRDNSRFNRQHFLAVVRGEKDLHSRPSRNGRQS